MQQILSRLALLALPGFAAAPGFASDSLELGRSMFLWDRARCHGDDAQGGGYFSAFLDTPAPDLTVLQKQNDGVFPEADLRAYITGELGTESLLDGEHIPRWEFDYWINALSEYGALTEQAEELADRYVLDRLNALVVYLKSIQTE